MQDEVPSVRTIEFLMRVRPAQLASGIKAMLRIKRVAVTSAAGCKYWVDPVSTFGLDLIKTGVYEPSMTRLLQRLLGPSDTFVDLGANEGYFSCLAARLGPKGCVFAIEPQGRLQRVLAENIRLNAIDNVQVVQQAIAEGDGTISLYLRPTTNSGASSMFRHWKLGWTTENVTTTSLDSFFAKAGIQSARLMKVDCEGAEKLVFAAADNTLKRGIIEYIALEFHPTIIGPEACRTIHKRLHDEGYELRCWEGLSVYKRFGSAEQYDVQASSNPSFDWLR